MMASGGISWSIMAPKNCPLKRYICVSYYGKCQYYKSNFQVIGAYGNVYDPNGCKFPKSIKYVQRIKDEKQANPNNPQ